MYPGKLFWPVLCLCIVFVSCRRDIPVQVDVINIRIVEDPAALLPYLSRSATASQISEKLYLPLADFDPNTLLLEPVLLTAIPQIRMEDGNKTYTMEIKKEANWGDGTPITSDDILYTLKMVANPFAKLGSVRSTLSNISDVRIEGKKKFTVTFTGNYHLDLEALINLPIIPSHQLTDAANLQDLPLPVLLTKGDSLVTGSDSSNLKRIYEAFQQLGADFTKLVTSGPYNVTAMTPGQILTLTKKTDWSLQEGFGDIESLQAFPNKINYLVLPDETGAIAALKAGQVDILSDLQPTNVHKLQNEHAFNDKFTIGCPDLLQYYYIGFNNNRPGLSEVNVRQALNHVINVDLFISSLMDGLATRITTPILQQKPYYAKQLKPVEYRPDLAASLLDSAGYTQRNARGVRYKIIDDKEVQLSFTLLTTGKQLGKDIAAIFSEEAAKLGVEIKAQTMEFSAIMNEVRKGNFDMANLVVRQFPGIDDPFLSWHSSNGFGNGGNYTNFSDPEIDKITENIRSTTNTRERNSLFIDFQNRLYNQYPAIFLFSPKNCIAVNKSLDISFSVKRPGYFENTFKGKPK